MNYEKRYKEMLAKARAFYKKWDGVDAYNSSLAISELKEIFPELKDSKKEWIEKIRQELKSYLGHRKTEQISESDAVQQWITWLEKQGEQKSIDKVEPQFHEGDWVIGANNVFKIISLNDELNCYTVVTPNNEEVKIPYYFDDGQGHMCSYHLWTIQDAKDGDVLCTYECNKPKIVFILKENPIVFILKGTSRKHYVLNYHCYYNIMYPCFESNFKTGCLAPNKEDVKPATEEQRNLLFQKMKEFGYEWDANKKELIKL
jgi:hypothetical protein